jgi:hypothetical protein
MMNGRGYKRIRTEEIVVDASYLNQEQYYQGNNNINNSNCGWYSSYHQQPLLYKLVHTAGGEPVITEPEDNVQSTDTSCIVEVQDINDLDFDIDNVDSYQSNFVSPEKSNEDDICSLKEASSPAHDHEDADNGNIDEVRDKIIEITVKMNKIIIELTVT